MNITFKGNKITLKGSPLSVGGVMPNFTLTGNDLAPVSLKDMNGTKVFVVVPSLDTGVCDLEVKNFNKKASELSGVSIYAVSLDLPFAQSRWCGANDVAAVKTLSDYSDRNFGVATGTFIDGLALLTRAIFVADKDNKLVYVEYVSEVTDHPNYDAVYAVLSKI